MAIANIPLTLFVDGDIGSDSNSGSTASGSPIVSGTAGATDTTSTVALDSSTDLSGVSVGDTIRLVGELSGFNNLEVYEILTINDGADTITVNPTPSSTASDITWHIGGAFKTLVHTVLFHINGNGQNITVNIKASVTYTEMPYFNGAQGIATAPMKWIGYTTTPGDNGIVTIDAESSRAYAIRTNGSNIFAQVTNIHGLNATTSAMGGNGQQVTWRNCKGSASPKGFFSASGTYFIGCYALNNTAIGFTGGGECRTYSCVAEGNGSHGINCDTGVVYGCLAVSNADDGINFDNSNDYQVVIGCTIDGDNDDSTTGIKLTDPNQSEIVNCIVYDCAVGIEAGSAGAESGRRANYNNLLNGNATDYVNWEEGERFQSGAPLFVNEGTDYGLQLGSPAEGNGATPAIYGATGRTNANGGIDIGAFAAPVGAAATGGGSGLAHSGEL